MLNKNQINDVLERAVATYLQTVVGLLSAASFGVEELSDLGTVKSLLVAGIPAALSVVKGALAAALPYGDESASVMRVGYESIRVVEVPVEKKPVKRATAAKKAPAKKAGPK